MINFIAAIHHTDGDLRRQHMNILYKMRAVLPGKAYHNINSAFFYRMDGCCDGRAVVKIDRHLRSDRLCLPVQLLQRLRVRPKAFVRPLHADDLQRNSLAVCNFSPRTDQPLAIRLAGDADQHASIL